MFLGTKLFFPLVTYSVFEVLPPKESGKLLDNLFPKYYTIGIVSSFFALLSFLIIILRANKKRLSYWIGTCLFAVMFFATTYSGKIMFPQIQEIKSGMQSDIETSEKEILVKRFSRLHSRAVFLDSFVIILGLGVLIIISHGYNFITTKGSEDQ